MAAVAFPHDSTLIMVTRIAGRVCGSIALLRRDENAKSATGNGSRLTSWRDFGASKSAQVFRASA
jgi:hypothetical protein